MMRRLLFLPLFIAPALPARGDQPPPLGLTAVSTPSREDRDQAELGLQSLWLPLESRTDLDDYVGRNLPGTALDSDGRLLLRGGRAEDTAYELDGLRVRRLSLPISMIEQLDVATAGYGAAWSDVLGGVVAARTCPGRNRFHAEVDVSAEFRDPARAVVSPAISGPIIRDRLFYLLGFQAQATRWPDTKDPEGIIQDPPAPEAQSQSSGLKLTFLPHPDHRLEGLTVVNAARRDNGAGLGIEKNAQPSYEQQEVTASLRWQGRWKAVTASSQLGFSRFRDEEMPIRCRTESGTCDNVPSMLQKFPRTIRWGNWHRHEIARETDWQAVNGLEATLLEWPRVRQRLRATSRVDYRQLSWESRTPGDKVTIFNGAANESEEVTSTNDPRFGDPQFGWFHWQGSSLATVHSLESETRLHDRLWIVPGVALAYDRAHADAFNVSDLALTPHLGLAWDVRGDGRTWLRASSHQRTGADLQSLVHFARRTPFTRTCAWDPDTASFSRNCFVSGADPRTLGRPCSPDGLALDGATCQEAVQLPRAWEHAAAAEHEPGLGLRLGLELVYRRPTALPHVRETNRIWNGSGTVQTGFRNGRAETVLDYTTDIEGQRYLDVTASARKQAGRLRLLAAYTWSRYRSVVYQQVLNRGPDIGGLVSVDDDRPHCFRTSVSYDFDGYGSVGATYAIESGAPPRAWSIPVNSFGDPRAAPGVNPGTNINDPGDDRRNPRGRSVQRFNLQLRGRLKRLVGLDFHLYADIINVFDRHTAAVEDPFSFTPLQPAGEGRWTRVGLEYRY